MSLIKQAIDFVISNVDDPIINHPNVDPSIKNKAQSSKQRVKSFKKVGDLYLYLKRFEKKPNPGEDEVYDAIKSLGLKTYEDIFTEFKRIFESEIDDITTLNDFVIGQEYTSWDISNFARNYNNQPGIYLIGEEPNYRAIFIKVTLENGKYPNQWIVKDRVLKYYLKSMGDKFSAEYKVNKAIIQSGNTPIYVFIKKDNTYELNGIFKYVKYHTEPDGSMWFELEKANSLTTDKPVTYKEFQKELMLAVKESSKLSKEERLQRIANAPKHPELVEVITRQYKKNPDVIAEVLERANGHCEACGNPAPFIRKSDGTPYLEVHHIIPLSKGGEDTVENTIALCPNCHRKAHFG